MEPANEKDASDDLDAFEAMLDRIEAEQKQRIQKIQKEGEGKTALVLANADHTQGVIIAPSAKRTGRYQASFFDARGFYTHHDAATRNELIELAVRTYQMTERRDDFLEQMAKEPFFHLQNARFWYQGLGASQTALRDLAILNAPEAGAKGVDSLLGAFCRTYQKELLKRHIYLIPGHVTKLTSRDRQAITKEVTRTLIEEQRVTKENASHYQKVLAAADPSGEVPELETIRSAIKGISNVPPAKRERKEMARTIVHEDIKKLFYMLQHNLHLTPDDVTRLVHEATNQTRTNARSAVR